MSEHTKFVHVIPANLETTQNRIRQALGKEPVYIPAEKEMRGNAHLIFYFLNASAIYAFFNEYELFGFSKITDEMPTWFAWALGITFISLLMSNIDGKVTSFNRKVLIWFSIPFILYISFFA